MFAFLLSMYPGVDLVVRTHSQEAKRRGFQNYQNTLLYSERGLVESQELLNKKVLGKESTCHIEKQ